MIKLETPDSRNRVANDRSSFSRSKTFYIHILVALALLRIVSNIDAQKPASHQRRNATSPTAVASPTASSEPDKLSERERRLMDRIEQLERRLAELEARIATASAGKLSQPVSAAPAAGLSPGSSMVSNPSHSELDGSNQIDEKDRGGLDFFRNTTINLTLDGYYGYNFNRPVGRINLLRAYDVMSNSFSQAALVALKPAKSVTGNLNYFTGQQQRDVVAVPNPGLPTGPITYTESQNGAFESSAGEEPQTQPSEPKWHYGGFIDLSYLLDFNHPSNHLFRSRGTAFHVNELDLNMAGAYVRKDLSESSRWGVQLTVQGGKDAEVFGFSATAPNIGGFKFLRHLGPTNVFYLAPVGKGLTVQGGIFSSLIGYDSLYGKDNFSYTRPWGADFTPYLMMGVNASYPFNEKLTGTFFVVNGYWHLANANGVPSSGGQLTYQASPRVTVKETVLWGPHQSNTSLKYWRFLSDSIVERRGDRVTFAFEYIASSERVNAPGSPRALMMAGQLPVHWALNKRWSATVRPEFFWDRDGRWTLARQTVKAITTTLEYRIPFRQTNTILRLEHRYDDSRGPDGGFFRGTEVRPGVVGLTPTQHLLIFGLIFTFDH